MKSVKGIYHKDGTVKLLEPVEVKEDTEIIITFVNESEKLGAWESIKLQIAERNPQLANKSKEELCEEFERLSEKAAARMETQFKNWKEAEKFMRGELYDPSGY